MAASRDSTNNFIKTTQDNVVPLYISVLEALPCLFNKEQSHAKTEIQCYK